MVSLYVKKKIHQMSSKKYNMNEAKIISTPMYLSSNLDKDETSKTISEKEYK